MHIVPLIHFCQVKSIPGGQWPWAHSIPGIRYVVDSGRAKEVSVNL